MPRNKRWFRFYERMIDSPQVLELSDGEFRLLASLWCLASPHEGAVPYSRLALRRRIALDTPELLDQMLDHLVALDLLTPDGDTWQIPRWEEHQYDYQSDIPQETKERKRRQRKQSHENVTRMSRENPGLDTDTESDPESESDPERDSDIDVPNTLPEGESSKDNLPKRVRTQPKPHVEDVKNIFQRYKERIQPNARICPDGKIKARLKTFTAPEILKAIENFAGDTWWMDNNAHQGAEWFFKNDGQIEKFLNLKPESKRDGNQNGGKPGNVPKRVDALSGYGVTY